MSKMILREMYQGCYKMWNWLAKNPKHDKSEYINIIGICRPILKNNCYACEYVKQRYRGVRSSGCRRCPLKSLWVSRRSLIDDYGNKVNSYFCEDIEGSPYEIWVNNNSFYRKSSARKIASYCKLKLKQLDKKNERRHAKNKSKV